MGERAAEAQAGFLLAVEHAYVETRLTLHAMQKVIAVASVTHGTRRDRFDSLGTELARQRCHTRDRLDGAGHRVVIEDAGLTEARREPRRGLHFVDDLNAATGRHVGDDLPNGVRADVDCRDASR